MSVAVRAKIEEHWYDASGTEVPTQVNSQDVAIKTIGTGWGLYNGYYYYYKTLDTQNEETSNFIPTVEFADIFDGNTCTSNGDGTKTCAVGAPYSTGRYSLVVTFEVIQADAYETEWAVNVDDNIEYNGYKITFDANGGSVNTPSKITGFNKNTNDFLVGELPTPIRSGYTFVGWYTQASGGTKLISTSTINTPTTLYAHWFKANNSNIKMAYVYDETATGNDAPNNHICVSGDELTCIEATCTSDGTTCGAGTIIEYQVNDSTTKRFHVLKDNGDKVLLQDEKNTVASTAWNATNDNTKGPTTIMQVLESATSSWSNVNDLSYSIGDSTSTLGYSACTPSGNQLITNCSTTKYSLVKSSTTSTKYKARIITVQEAVVFGNINEIKQSYPIWMYNYLSGSTSYGGTVASDGNGFYWTMTSYSNSNTEIYVMYNSGVISAGSCGLTYVGARAVVEINK